MKNNFLFGLLAVVFLLGASSVSATCIVQGYFHNSTGDMMRANSSVYCQGLGITNNLSSNLVYATSFGGLLDNCNICSPLILTTATNATLGVIGTNSTTSGFGVGTIEMNVTLSAPVPAALTWVLPTPLDGSRQRTNYANLDFTFTDSFPDTCKMDVNGTNSTGVIAGGHCTYNKTSLGEGTVSIKGYLNNTYGQSNSTVTRTFTTDYTPPQSVAWSPTMLANASNTSGANYIYWNATFTEALPGTCYIQYSGVNHTGNIVGKTCYYNQTGATNGTTYIGVAWVSDSVGNWNNSVTRYITVEYTPPVAPDPIGEFVYLFIGLLLALIIIKLLITFANEYIGEFKGW